MKNNNKLSFLLYVWIVGIVISFLLIIYMGYKYSKKFISYGEASSKRIVLFVINDSLSLSNYKDIDIGNILIIKSNNIDLDVNKSNLLLDRINKRITDNLNCISSGNIDFDIKGLPDIDYNNFKNGFVYSIPMGSLFGNGFISNIGPNIPVKILLIGDVMSYMDSSVKEYGINNAMIEVRINVKVSILVSMLFTSKRVTIESSRVVIMKIIQGEIPSYYFR